MSECVCCKKNPAVTKCTLCQAKLYCGQQCKDRHWPTHQHECNNIFTVAAGCTVAQPYGFEDCAQDLDFHGTDKESLFDEKIMLRTFNSNKKIEDKVVPLYDNVSEDVYTDWTIDNIPKATVEQTFGTLGVGEKPNTKEFGQYYEIEIQQDQYTVPLGQYVTNPHMGKFIVSGRIPDDMIFKGNDKNEKANKLAKSRILKAKKADKLLFWPDTDDVVAAAYSLLQKGGWLHVIVRTFDSQVALEKELAKTRVSMDLYYEDIQFEGKGGILKRGRRIAGAFSRQLKIKGINPSNHAALRAKSVESMEVRIIFETTGQRGKMISDIEVLVPTNIMRRSLREMREKGEKDQTVVLEPASNRLVQNFSCDPHNRAQVLGLYQALEENIGELKEEIRDPELTNREKEDIRQTLSSFQAVASTVNQHLLTKPRKGDDISYKVISAINQAEKLNWERIELRWKAALDKNFYKMHKDDDIASLENIVDSLGIPEPGEGFKAKAKSWLLGKRGKAKGRLRAIEKILDERLTGRGRSISFAERQTDPEYLYIKGLHQRVREVLGNK